MLRFSRALLIGVTVLAVAPASAREACQERTLSLRYSPQVGRNWCWAAQSASWRAFGSSSPTS